jgi:hypothetical protein
MGEHAMKECRYSSFFLFMLLIGMVVFFLSGEVVAKNLIKNGEFDDQQQNWVVRWVNTGGGAGVTFSINDEELLSGFYCLMAEITGGGTNTWDIQYAQALPIVAGTTYALSFMAMKEGGSGSVDINVTFETYGDPYTKYLWETATLQDAPDEYGPYEFTAEVDDDTDYLKFFIGATDDIIVYLDAVVVDDGEPETAVDLAEGTGSPTAFNLSQNFPNPFNPTTQIHYTLAEASHVRLFVYDLQGKVVADLVDGQQPAGSYAVSFNAQGLPSGTYFYRLEARQYTETKKMVVLR